MKVSPPCQKFLVFAALTIITMKPYIQINSCIYMSNISISALCELSSVFEYIVLNYLSHCLLLSDKDGISWLFL